MINEIYTIGAADGAPQEDVNEKTKGLMQGLADTLRKRPQDVIIGRVVVEVLKRPNLLCCILCKLLHPAVLKRAEKKFEGILEEAGDLNDGQIYDILAREFGSRVRDEENYAECWADLASRMIARAVGNIPASTDTVRPSDA